MAGWKVTPEEEQWRKSGAKAAARSLRWQAPTSARVVHPLFGDIVVPHRSNYAALLCAAEVWGVDWMSIRDAEVLRIK